MPFWNLRRRFVAALVGLIVLALGWAAVVVAVALAGAHDQATTSDAIAVLGAAQSTGAYLPSFAHASTTKPHCTSGASRLSFS